MLKLKVDSLQNKIDHHLHSLEVCVSIIGGIEVLIGLLPGLVNHPVPGCGGDGGELVNIILIIWKF